LADTTLHKGGIRVDKRGLDKEVEEIVSHIKQGHNFILSGGAGSGKTYSLVEVLKQLSISYPKEKIACITYTNAAAIEIMNRASVDNLTVSTIHDFLWDNISLFRNEERMTLIELVNDAESGIKNPIEGEMFVLEDNIDIQYKEYTKLSKGIISHDEVLKLANAMFKKYPKLCNIVKDKYKFIFVDEYQDTSPLVIDILLKHLQGGSHKNIIGFFGDSMQSIYDGSIGNIDKYVENKTVYKVEKQQNRRNPNAVIKLANQLRLDGMKQNGSDDINAPNMVDGMLKEGTAKFLYSNKNDASIVKKSKWCQDWDFGNANTTKELRLTHNLIADVVGFNNLMDIYDRDPIYNFVVNFNREAKSKNYIINRDATFEDVVNGMNWEYDNGYNIGRQHIDVFLERDGVNALYDYIKSWTYEKVNQIYMNKDSLIDDKVEIEGVTIREAKRDDLIQHLFKIQDITYFYENKIYDELLRKTQTKIERNSDKKNLVCNIEKLISMENNTIEKVIDFADQSGLCVKDDKFNIFVERNEYLYWRVKQVAYSEFKKLYEYLDGFTSYSTQHKIKGLEFKNVLVILQNGGWNKYNFEYLFDKETKNKRETYKRVLERTKKLFYVCCTRAKDNLVVYYPSPTQEVLKGAMEMFGEENCVNLDNSI
jgi:DNA helicase-2/ATP-dependent DNA helicase PcrA